MTAPPATSRFVPPPDQQLESNLLALSRDLDAGTLRYWSGFLAGLARSSAGNSFPLARG